jgi:hypothetical protein
MTTTPQYPLPTRKQPSMARLLRLMEAEGLVPATDGCHVEPDGSCPHGHPSWLVRLGLI